jgi:hypothetical protein
MVANTDRALSKTCEEFNAIAEEYSVAPIFMKQSDTGGHEWIVEFDTPPDDFNAFSRRLDKNLQELNSDYAAKRSYDLALTQLKITAVSPGTFHAWMKSRGKYGGQNKVPRLSNDREYLDQILLFASKQTS